MPGRLEYERAVRISGLPAPARHIALTLATWADIETGVIPDRYQPSQKGLLAATGMGKPTLLKYLKTLTVAGWVSAAAPTPHAARTQHARTHYSLTVPPGLGLQVTQPGSTGDPASKRAGSAGDPALGQGVTQPGSTGDPELGQQVTTRVPSPGSPSQSPAADVGRPANPLRVAEPRAGVERKRTSTTTGQLPLLLPVSGGAPDHRQLAEQMTAHYGAPVSIRHAAAVALAVLDGRGVNNPTAYVMAAVRRDPARHRPTPTPPLYRAPERAAGDS